MSISIEAASALLEHVLNNVDWANVGDAAGLQNSASAGSLYLSAHTASPGTGSSQATNECAYGAYARVTLARDGTKWTVTSGQAENTLEILFPQALAGTETITHVAIGTASSGAGHKLFFAAVTAPVAVVAGVIPTFAAGDLTITPT